MISETQRKLLTEVFTTGSKTMDAKKFRAKHAKLRHQIDLLEKSGFVKRRQDQNTDCYSLCLLGLNEINNSDANNMLELMSKLFSFMRKSYISDPDKPISYSELAHKFGISINDVHQLLEYMRDVPILASWPNNPMYLSSASITIHESILDYETLQDGIDQQVEWAANRLNGAEKSNSSIFSIPQGVDTRHSNSADQQRLRLRWPKCVPDTIFPILEEISAAFENQLFALTVMGLRSVIDLVGSNIFGDKRFTEMLSELVGNGYLTLSQKENLESALEAGHAAIHRGYIPSAENTERVAEIVYHLLVSVYGNQHKEKLEQSTPKRKRQNEPENQPG